MSAVTHPKLKADPNRIVSEQFAQVFRAYLEASDEVQEVIREMCEVVNDPNVDEDDYDAAIDTLIEALFPVSHNGELGIDIGDLRRIASEHSEEYKKAIHDSDAQERTFAERLESLMNKYEMNQSELAKKSGVGQPAISMMLKRHCRPQLRTIERLAAAFGIKPKELWPT